MSLVTSPTFSFNGTIVFQFNPSNTTDLDFSRNTNLQFNQSDITNFNSRMYGTCNGISFNVDNNYYNRILLHPNIMLIKLFFRKINKYLKLNQTSEEIQSSKAEKKSWDLVKQWITPEEFAALTSKGEMEVQSKQDKDTIYIIKRNPNAVIEEKLYGKRQNSYCLVPKESGLASGDGFLSKLLLLQNNENKFKEIAVKACMLDKIRIGAVCYYKAEKEWSKFDKKAFDEFNSISPNNFNTNTLEFSFYHPDTNVTCTEIQCEQLQNNRIENGVVC